jgi:cytolysin-activating lysine-acyltransferase
MTTHPFQTIAPAFNAPATSDAESFGSAIWLWMQSNKHCDRPLFALKDMLLAPIQLGQYVLVMEHTPHGAGRRPIGYLGWANLSAEAEARYVDNPLTGLRREDWNSGDRMWFIDFVAPLGHAAQVHATWKPLLAHSSGRYMYHRSNERGVQIRKFVGARVSAQEASHWWAQRPVMAVPPAVSQHHNA